ncbi:LytTR family DNA-binding domain-containing protein [Spirosoma agri]|uniref:LytTR family transcriptional regulator n=1 Tax=Spirosoma agri TaxID=1987381 RepID=A0A6M0IDU9_9BACT|nr:LytTR family DNA-binding domain-containing protein [Spirosoma agri]NEU65521.1 LytTR family transcriptional regulator [Spirosoma agri]
MVKLLSQPFPIEDALGRQFLRAALMGLFVGLFLLIFQPFGLATWETANKLVKILGFGLITFLITAFNLTIWPRLFPRQYTDERWTIGREIVSIMVHVLLIAIANRVYLEWLVDEGKSGIGWVSMLVITFLIALFPVTGAVLFSYIRQLKKYSRAAAELPIHPPETGSPESIRQAELSPNALSDTTLTLVADNDKDTITLSSTELLFIESSDNYCTVVYLKNSLSGQSQPVKPLLRSSLSRLESQITSPHIVRCHRSYVVNLDRVERVTGNAQGYKLHLSGGQFQVPVARKYNETLVAELKAL